MGVRALPDPVVGRAAGTLRAYAALNAVVPVPIQPVPMVQHAAAGVWVTSAGSAPSTSPSTKPGYLNSLQYRNSTTRNVSNERVGDRPNTMWHAVDAAVVKEHGTSYCSLRSTTPDAIAAVLACDAAVDRLLHLGDALHKLLPLCIPYAEQGSRVWFAGREHTVTGSILGSLIGLDQPRAFKPPDATSHGNSSAPRAFKQVIGAGMLGGPKEVPVDEMSRIRMEYGSNHEFNGIKALHDQQASVPDFVPFCSLPMKIKETGLILLDVKSLNPKAFAGVDLPNLPAFGSSPDALLFWQGSSSSDEVVNPTAVEVKVTSPFYVNVGPENKAYGCRIADPRSRLTPCHLAQCQAHMIVLKVGKCVVISQGVEKSNVFVVNLDLEWCRLMFLQLQQVASEYLVPKAFPPANFGDNLVGRVAFIDHTKRLCDTILVHAVLNTVKGADSARFLPPL